ncbi:MAG TPA: signal peptidase II [Microbacteriaceae bacterium]|nr:signal peptidase II [Microbacteriaceae bacterium]
MPNPHRREITRPSPRALATLAIVAVCWYGLDQLTKYLVVTHLPYERSVDVIGTLLQFFYITNSGAAFSIGSGSTWIFSIIGAGTLLFIVWYARRIRSLAWATLFGLLLGGLCGNLSDRLLRPPGFGLGRVVDFIKIPLLPAYFNIADAGITASMALFIILTIRGVGLDGRVERLARVTDDAAVTGTPGTAAPDAQHSGTRPPDGPTAEATRPRDDTAGGPAGS